MVQTTRKIGLIGFSTETAKVFREQNLNIAAHIYSNHKNKKKRINSDDSCQNFHDWKEYNFRDAVSINSPAEIIEAAKEKYFDEFISTTDRWPWSASFIKNWGDYNNLFKVACDYAYGWIKKHQIECLFFSNVPHQGIAISQFAVAKALGIKTYIFLQSPFPGKSWIVEDWTDIGKFETSKTSSRFHIDINEPSAQPFYMKNVKGNQNLIIRNIAKQIRARSLVTLGLNGFKAEERKRNFHINSRRWQNAVESSYYYKRAKGIFCDLPQAEDYIYFPLHLQPEMTTDVLGGKYADQLLALEHLREIMPDKVAIYIKENPKQTGLFRSETFFERLSKLRNAKFLDKSTPSFELIKNSKAVATITGTAGWEAIRMKKPAIVFGNVYWNNLPGAFRFSKELKWKSVSEFVFDKKQLQSAANELSRFAHDGICDIEYSVMVKDYDEHENALKLTRILHENIR